MNLSFKKILINVFLIINIHEQIDGLTQIPNCGLKPPKGFIVRGKEVDKHEFPFIALVKLQGNTLCGGAILDDNWIVTAAHCFKDKMHQKNDLTIHLGAHNLNDGDVYKVDKIVNHQKFTYETMNSDITLLKTDSKIKFSKKVGTICLPEKMSEPNGRLTVAGWGRLFTKGPPSPTLQKISLPIITDQECSNLYAKLKIMVFKTNVCTFEPGHDTCEGDSGGPAFQYNGNVATLVGVVSFGWECADTYPGAFTQVSYFVDWINTQTAEGAVHVEGESVPKPAGGTPVGRSYHADQIKPKGQPVNYKSKSMDIKPKGRNLNTKPKKKQNKG